jgi:outer membrane protein OmpA-like peptidoglycan-associated protein
MKFIALTAVFGIATLTGCASAPVPPRELVEARAAMSHASQGPAARLALVDLHSAQGDLNIAERSFTDDPGSDVTRDLSYVALRRAQIASARGETLQADEEQARAHRDGAALTGERLALTQSALQGTQQALQDTRQTVAMTQAQLADETQRRAVAERQAATALESLRRVAAVRAEQRGTIITLSGEVLFATGQSMLLPIAEQRLTQVARALIDQGARHLVVEGHTDSRGSPANNQALSVARAQSVRSFLISHGIPDAQVEAIGLGSTRPVATNDTAEGRANNRRVEIVVAPMAPIATPTLARSNP